MSDPFDLERFVEAQERVIDRVEEELRRGRKRSHWMWFVFPQIAGLGVSAMSRRYAISGLEEAKAYLGHPVLGERLRAWTQLVLDLEGRSAHEIFGTPDDLKFHACMTLFARAAAEAAPFKDALIKYFEGEEDGQTISRL